MRARRGDNPKAALGLLYRHVAWIDSHLSSCWLSATTRTARREFSRAGLANAGAWEGWLRGGELFSVEWAGCRVIEPEDSPRFDLPAGLDAVLWDLSEQTKSNRHAVADVVMAYTTSSGLSLGKWMHRFRASLGLSDFPATVYRRSHLWAWGIDLSCLGCLSSTGQRLGGGEEPGAQHILSLTPLLKQMVS
jgi:hypothetical protein